MIFLDSIAITVWSKDDGNLNFHSSVHEWLVVSGDRVQYKGVGTINGAGNFGFLLTAIDSHIIGGGGTDKYRIKYGTRITTMPSSTTT